MSRGLGSISGLSSMCSCASSDLDFLCRSQRCRFASAAQQWARSPAGARAPRGAPRTAATELPRQQSPALRSSAFKNPRGHDTRVWMELRGAAIVRLGQAQSAEHLGAGSERAPAAPLRNARGRSALAAGARRGSGTAANGTAGRSAATVRTRKRGPRPKGASSSSRPATSEASTP